MAIERIDSNLCNGCGLCIDACLTDVIRMDEKTQKAVIEYPEDCLLCLFCELDCPEHAIFVSPIKRIPATTTVG